MKNKMTRQQVIEQLRSWVEHQHITNVDDLKLEISCAEYEGDEPIEEFDDIIHPLGMNLCDRCGDIHDSEFGLFWLDGFDWEDENPTDQAILNGINKEKIDYCAVCYKCLKELEEKGKEK